MDAKPHIRPSGTEKNIRAPAGFFLRPQWNLQRMFQAETRLLKDSRTARKERKRLFKLSKLKHDGKTPKVLAKVEKKFLKRKHPDENEFKERWAEKVKEFCELLASYLHHFNERLQLLEELSFLTDKEEYDEIYGFNELLEATLRQIEAGKSVQILESSLDEFYKKFEKFKAKMDRNLDREMRDDVNLGARGKVRRFWAWLTSYTGIVGRDRRAVRKMLKHYTRFFETHRELLDQLTSPEGLKPGVLINLRSYFLHLEKLILKMSRTKNDLEELCSRLEKEYDKTMKIAMPFIQATWVKDAPGFEYYTPIHQELAKHKEIMDKFRKFLGSDYANLTRLKRLVDTVVNSDVQRFVSEAKQQTRTSADTFAQRYNLSRT